jgi:riboflavin synthase
MFTGLIEDVGRLAGRHRSGDAWKLEVETALPLEQVKLGDSIAVNGVCLTVETLAPARRLAGFHTLDETLKRSNLGKLSTGAAVNLEQAMAANGRFGGHVVSGHVDTTSRILAISRVGHDWAVTMALPESLKPLMVPKGSIAVNGISLTIAVLGNDSFQVHLIPHSWEQTNLSRAQVGDLVNLEADMLGKYVVRQLELGRTGATMDQLAQAGFMD